MQPSRAKVSIIPPTSNYNNTMRATTERATAEQCKSVLHAMNWDLEQTCSNILASWKARNGDSYLELFMSLPADSRENEARQKLRGFWDSIMHNQTLLECDELWRKEHWFRLLMRAKDHLFLVEPFDEADFIKREFYLGEDGGYWKCNNRPDRYDKIEEKLGFFLKEHQNRREILKGLFPDSVPNNKSVHIIVTSY